MFVYYRITMIICLCFLCLGACEVKPSTEQLILETSRSDGGSLVERANPTDTSSKESGQLDHSEQSPDSIRPENSDKPDGSDSPDVRCKPFLLLDHLQWKKVEREQDPYRALAPAGKCDDVAYRLEDGVIEVKTGICSFVTVVQPLKRALKVGEQLKLIYWHLQLTAASSSHGYVSLTIGNERIYVNKIPIPAAPKVYEIVIPVKKNFTKGEKLYFHIHNHGSNIWKLLDLNVMCPKI